MKYLKWYFGLYKTVTSPSRYTSSILSSQGIHSAVVPNGIDTGRFNLKANSERFKKRFSLYGKTVFMHVGRLVFEKNIDLLIESALLVKEEVPDAVFVIVGSGPAKEQYKSRVREKGLESLFVFTGFVPDEELPEAYSACDVFAFPSKFETQGLVALEAMACGKPVACASKSATSELISEGKNGFSFSDSPDDCAQKLILCSQSSKKMASFARKKAEEYSIEKCTSKMLKAYDSAL